MVRLSHKLSKSHRIAAAISLVAIVQFLHKQYEYSRIRCFEEFIWASKHDAGQCRSKLLELFTNLMLGIK